ncbi:hypothetical protein FNV43_RR25140 [Rhamnella rubrinervis]|uniref:Uncharacterized protein n=1 Tax=Rhamnella rubrinervis TaxID=2594499 RepID=A0A8K0GLW5_9ROSA|nr:hypothetical protein FNV43_RR25140 [Rhamnella rubrinervis]
MVNLVVQIISKQTVKPSSSPSDLHHLKPYKLCLFDQLTPATYASLVFFYPISDPNFNLHKTLTRLKNSLSETLTLYYPFSGRTKDNLYIDDFHEGVPFLETRVNCRVSEYFKLKDTELLNHFIPFQPFCKEKETTSFPLLAFQVNLFACGGIALGISMCHKIMDGNSLSSFLKSWAAIFSGSPNKVIQPDLSLPSSLFPPRVALPQKYMAFMDQLWFKESNFITKRFVFDAKSIAELRAKAKSQEVPNPTRNEALTGFIWKHAMGAFWKISSGSPRTSILAHAVNLRPRMRLKSPEKCTGNVFWWRTVLVIAQSAEDKEVELHRLVGLLREALAVCDVEEELILENLHGEDGFNSGMVNQLEGMLSLLESEKLPDIFAFTRWSSSFFNDLDFGWGKPFWLGVMGKVGPEFRNLVILVDTQCGNGIEAWVTLEDKLMAVLENDPIFLAFATLNPGIISSL